MLSRHQSFRLSREVLVIKGAHDAVVWEDVGIAVDLALVDFGVQLAYLLIQFWSIG